MSEPVLVLCLGTSISFALSFLLIRFARRLPFSKNPTDDRWHHTVTPDSGGIAIFISIAIVYLLLFRGQHAPVAIAAAAFWVLGTLDDRFRFTVRYKLGVQAFIVTLVVANGVVFAATSLPIINLFLTWFWLIGITNAFNLIDNMDGLASGVVIIIALSRAVLLFANGFAGEAELSLLIAGAFLGLLWFNFNPARIFMGDGGSMLAGFTLAALAIDSPAAHTTGFVFSGILYPALTFAYPIFDTALVSLLRTSSGRSILMGGRDHSSHRLASLGMRERHVVFVLWLFTAVGSATGLLLNRSPVLAAVAISLLSVFATMFAIFLASLPLSLMPYTLPADRSRLILRWLPSVRAPATIVLDAILVAIAVVAVFALRFDLDIPASQYRNMLVSIPVIVTAHVTASVLFRTYQCSWTFFTFRETLPLLGAMSVSALACTALYFLRPEYSRGVVLLYVAIAGGLTFVVRFSLNMFREVFRGTTPARPFRRVAIFRADFEGEALARFLLHSPAFLFRPVAFLDDRPLRHGAHVCGLPVRNIDTDMRSLREELRLDAIVLPPQLLDKEEHLILGHQCHPIGLELCSLDMHLRTWNGVPDLVAAAE